MTSRNSLRIRPPKPAPRVSRWEWLNKPIVLWLLSSVVLGFGTFIYGEVQANRQAALAKQLTIDKYNALIGVRLTFAMQRLFEFRKQETKAENIGGRKAELLEITRDLLNGAPATNLYPEYENVSIIGLTFQSYALAEQRDFSIPNFTSFASYENRILSAATPALVDEEAVRLLTFVRQFTAIQYPQSN